MFDQLQLVTANAEDVASAQFTRALNALAVDVHAILAAQIFDHDLGRTDPQPCMPTRHGWIADRKLALRAPAQVQLAGPQRDQRLPVAQLDRDGLADEPLFTDRIVRFLVGGLVCAAHFDRTLIESALHYLGPLDNDPLTVDPDNWQSSASTGVDRRQPPRQPASTRGDRKRGETSKLRTPWKLRAGAAACASAFVSASGA